MANSTNNARRTSNSSAKNSKGNVNNNRVSDSRNSSNKNSRNGNSTANRTSNRNGSSTGNKTVNRLRKQKQQKMKKILLVAEIVLILAIATGGIIYFQKNKDNAIEVTVDKEDKAKRISV